MDGAELIRRAHARTRELPGAELGTPVVPDWDVYKVRGRVFMLLTEVTGEALVTVKADPAASVALRAPHEDVTPGYHMNKKHWITLHAGGTLDGEEVDDLVTESYLLVLERNVPRAHWPVDPATFGQDATG